MSIFVNHFITKQVISEAQERAKEDVNRARYVYASKVKDIDRTIHWISIRHVLKRGLKEKNIFPLRNELQELMVDEGLDFMTLADRKGVVIFMRISTNVMDKEGNRAIGTRAMKEVQEQVLGQGLPWIQRAFVVDDWYITAYEPIRDVQDKIVGMLYVGMLESKYAVMKERLILLFFFFSMSGMLIALAVSFFLSWTMLKK